MKALILLGIGAVAGAAAVIAADQVKKKRKRREANLEDFLGDMSDFHDLFCPNCCCSEAEDEDELDMFCDQCIDKPRGCSCDTDGALCFAIKHCPNCAQSYCDTKYQESLKDDDSRDKGE